MSLLPIILDKKRDSSSPNSPREAVSRLCSPNLKLTYYLFTKDKASSGQGKVSCLLIKPKEEKWAFIIKALKMPVWKNSGFLKFYFEWKIKGALLQKFCFLKFWTFYCLMKITNLGAGENKIFPDFAQELPVLTKVYQWQMKNYPTLVPLEFYEPSKTSNNPGKLCEPQT